MDKDRRGEEWYRRGADEEKKRRRRRSLWTRTGARGRRWCVRGPVDLASFCSRGTHRWWRGLDDDLPRRLPRLLLRPP
ncbi:hypothetical protein QVD17_26002 [Tagetes erecta]|uniref:Uncharacterized protein n=1 Tax=Tagetes erecta TaxID=13708 RepID=A0AAD8NQE7_TARER|nr:hypothetical protein QVD17_26002 [Tagetes erecta]